MSDFATLANVSVLPAQFDDTLLEAEQIALPALAVSIIIVSYNSRHYLEACLNSVLQTTDSHCEVIVLDNASQDGSADFVASSFPQIKIIRNPTNVGFASGNNLAVAQAAGLYIVGLNPDTVVSQGWLDALLAPLKKRATSGLQPVGMTTPRILLLRQPNLVNTCGNSMHFTGLTICRGLGKQADAPALSQDCEVSAVSGACFAVRQDLWQSLGGFDEDFFTYLEDTDLSLRVRLAGYACLYVADAVIYHDYTNRFSNHKLFYLERNRWLLLLKNYQIRTLVCLLPALLLTEIVTWFYSVKTGRKGIQAKFRAWVWLTSHWGELNRKRQQVQQLRQVTDAKLLAGLDWRLDINQLTSPKIASVFDATLNPCFHLIYWFALHLGVRK